MRQADLYIRVSTEEQADKGYSQRDQEERLRKYCELKEISVRYIFIEDHSAKSFNRPQWQKYLSTLRKIKNNKNSTILLFTKWDRFSRNAGDAYQMLNILRSFGVEPGAIEQPLDLSIPENKIMLAFYLASPEVENDRRALNIFHGMRRAKKEGRYMGTAPLGYVNRITEDKKKYIGIDAYEGPLLKWAFEQILANNFNTDQIWKQLWQKCKGKGRFSKNNFWIALRNPLYCGKIFIPPYKEEEGFFVLGQHEPLISVHDFNEVQSILDGRKKQIKPKIVSAENLPLRGFLKCPNCNRMLTGSSSKGKMGVYYNYYHCSTDCGVRYKAELVNETFTSQLKELSPRKEMIDIFLDSFIYNYEVETKTQNRERKNILEKIRQLNDRHTKALIKNADGIMDDQDFLELKKITKKSIEKLEDELNNLSNVDVEIKDLMKTSFNKISNLSERYENGTIEEKRIIISSMFPENLEFDGTQHRTQRLNEAITLIYQNSNKLRGKKKGTNLSFLDLSPKVEPQGIEPWSKQAIQ
ncbi:recombinase family protein [Flavobacterium sp. xlx-214]|uniref:recombinase family protein n=1 Tax=unclassified Flavobacterium TaxID=196869 RepID=UPI0013D429A6|nr:MULTISPECIES: recombinase family protein [unclassified Flavobacterium]MBA5793492.1 recombinase family protein [Flavobacterium sp. xlx-221]QMI82738.1 recombinase family protein [Flavobacterium sp. xlx-214]